MHNSAEPKELYHEFSIISAQEVPPESKQKESSDATPFSANMKDVHSEQEGKRSWQEWPSDRLHYKNALQDETQSADALKELLLQ